MTNRTIHAVAIVRDKATGIAKLDNPERASPAVLMALTRADRQHHGLWAGDLVRDAEGVKRVTVLEPGLARAEDALVAASMISIDGRVFEIKPRVDVPAGGTIGWRA